MESPPGNAYSHQLKANWPSGKDAKAIKNPTKVCGFRKVYTTELGFNSANFVLTY